jgi:hypothetical protein
MTFDGGATFADQSVEEHVVRPPGRQRDEVLGALTDPGIAARLAGAVQGPCERSIRIRMGRITRSAQGRSRLCARLKRHAPRRIPRADRQLTGL